MYMYYYNGVCWVDNPIDRLPFWGNLFPICEDWKWYTPLGLVQCRWWELADLMVKIEKELTMSVYENAFEKLDDKLAGRVFRDPAFASRYPTLHAYMTDVELSPGRPRIVATVMLFCEDGAVKARLNERQHNLSLWVTSSSILEAFQSLEEGLGKRPIDWRENKANGSATRIPRPRS